MDKILLLLEQIRHKPTLVFISETRMKDSDSDLLLSSIRMNGYNQVLNNSATNAGGTALYISNNVRFIERNDIKFNFDGCEACFIEVECEGNNVNHVFGVLYRHPLPNAKNFNSYLGEFLEYFASNKIKLTIFGDINVDLNKTNRISTEYINTLNSSGFETLINQPTRICHYEPNNHTSFSTLDHIITNSSPSFSKVGILVSDVSDHLPIFGFMSLSKSCKNPPKK